MSSRFIFRSFLVVCFIGFLVLFIVGYRILSHDNSDQFKIYNDFFVEEFDDDHRQLEEELQAEEKQEEIITDITEPIILWWTPFTGEKGKYKTCGKVKCFFTINRAYRKHPKMKVFLFYGTDFKIVDLPLPRHPHHEWGVLHEELPKNNYFFSFPKVMTLFNHTCTFRRESDYSISTQYVNSIEWLESDKYMVPTSMKNKYQAELAPLIYVHTDCQTPSDRDHYTKMLMKYIKVDSYGKCLHNKDLPDHLRDPLEGMDHHDFYKLFGKYKFALAMENGRCNDYMTEKLWRPLMTGTVPVVLGAQTVKDFLPSNHSAIHIDDFKTVKDLATFLHQLNDNDAEYEKYLAWKKTGVTNKYLKKLLKEREWSLDSSEYPSFHYIDGFECFVCKRIHENIKKKGALKYQATIDHYGCPKNKKFDENGSSRLDNSISFPDEWLYYEQLSSAFRYFIDKNITFTKKELVEKSGIEALY